MSHAVLIKLKLLSPRLFSLLFYEQYNKKTNGKLKLWFCSNYYPDVLYIDTYVRYMQCIMTCNTSGNTTKPIKKYNVINPATVAVAH